MSLLFASLRLVAASMLICVLGYTAAVLGVAQLFPDTARGSLIATSDGTIVGSRLIAQNFSEPGYFWPRPSAAGAEGYDATAAAGSNKSPTSADLTVRAQVLIARYGATPERPLPPELVTASGGGLDPHISEQAALYQAERVAAARGLPLPQVEAVIVQNAFAPGGLLTATRLVNVLELNLALDGAAPRMRGAGALPAEDNDS